MTGWGWVAPAAFGLSVVSLLWQAVVSYARSPRLQVGLTSQVIRARRVSEADYTVSTTFTITVHNRGAEDVELFDLGLETETGASFSARNSEQEWKGVGERMRRAPRWVQGDELPVMIRARSTKEWTILNGATVEHGPSVGWRGWAEQYRASGKNKHAFSKTVLHRARSDA